MNKLVAISALAAAMSIAIVAQADAWGRSWSSTGPRGTTTGERSGSCSGGSCSWNAGGSGPNGGSWSRSGSANCAGGTCDVSGQGSGSGGRGYSYGGSVTR